MTEAAKADFVGTGGRIYTVDPPAGSQNWVARARNTARTTKSRVLAWNFRQISSNLIEICGIGAISGGCAMIYAPAGLITAGVGLVLVGIATNGSP